jgi:hypothetical protein
MAGISKYETFAQQTLGDVYFKPNLDLINQSLAARQGKHDTNLATMKGLKAKIGDVNTIEGYDQDRYHQKVQEYDTDIDKLKGLYNGDLSRADNELDDFTRKLSDDFGRHGEFNAMQQNYNSYAANAKSLAERRNKNEISEAQYAELSRRLKAYQPVGIGKDAKNWNGWNTLNLTDRIDKDKFLLDFVAIKEKEKESQGWYRDKNEAGKLIWRKNEHEYIGYDDLLAEGKQALQNKLKETGEIEYEYKYHLDQTGEPSVAAYQTRYQVVADKTNEKLRKISTLSGAELQTELKTLYPDLKVTGLDDATTKQYKDHAIKALTEKANQYQTKLDESKQWNDMTVKGLHRQQWEEDWLTGITHPYAGAKSHDRFDPDIKIESDPYLQQSFEMQKLKFQRETEEKMIKFKYDLDNPAPVEYGLNTEGYYVKASTGENAEQFEEIKKTTEAAEGSLITDFAGGLYRTLFENANSDKSAQATLNGEGLSGAIKNENDLIMQITHQMNGNKSLFKSLFDAGKAVVDKATGKPVEQSTYKKLDAEALMTAELDGSGRLTIHGQPIELKGLKLTQGVVDQWRSAAEQQVNAQLALKNREEEVEEAVYKNMNLAKISTENPIVTKETLKNPFYNLDNDPTLTASEKQNFKNAISAGRVYIPKEANTKEKQDVYRKYEKEYGTLKTYSNIFNKEKAQTFQETGKRLITSVATNAPLIAAVGKENYDDLEKAIKKTGGELRAWDNVQSYYSVDGKVRSDSRMNLQQAALANRNDPSNDTVEKTTFVDLLPSTGDGMIRRRYVVTYKNKNGQTTDKTITMSAPASETMLSFGNSENIFEHPQFKAASKVHELALGSVGQNRVSKVVRTPAGNVEIIGLTGSGEKAAGGGEATFNDKEAHKNMKYGIRMPGQKDMVQVTQSELQTYLTNVYLNDNVTKNLSTDNPKKVVLAGGRNVPLEQAAKEFVKNTPNDGSLSSNAIYKKAIDYCPEFAQYPSFFKKQFNIVMTDALMDAGDYQAFGNYDKPRIQNKPNNNSPVSITNIKSTTTR